MVVRPAGKETRDVTARVDIFDGEGNKVCSLESEPGPGMATLHWNGAGSSREPVAPGEYRILAWVTVGGKRTFPVRTSVFVEAAER